MENGGTGHEAEIGRKWVQVQTQVGPLLGLNDALITSEKWPKINGFREGYNKPPISRGYSQTEPYVYFSPIKKVTFKSII